MIKIVPAILTSDVQVAKEKIVLVDGLVERVSIDIVDGVFAKVKTIDPVELADIQTTLKIDFQLMVFDPVSWVDKCLVARADRIIGHVEFMNDIRGFIVAVKEKGVGVGLGLDIDTEFEKVPLEVLSRLDVVLLMAHKSGASGLAFEDRAYKKITQAIQARVMNSFSYLIHVDGGVNKEIAKKLQEMGVDEVSMASNIFVGNPSYNLKEISNYLS